MTVFRLCCLLPALLASALILNPALASPAPTGALTNRLLILAPDSFHSALEEFVVHKQKLLPTELHSLEGILRVSAGMDDPEKLKRFLYDEWHRRGLGYALLVGDVDLLPVRFTVLDRVTTAAFDYAFYPSDLYYSDLAKADGSFSAPYSTKALA